ncbi:hypothetical protein ACDY96_15845 [Rhizobium mongolense]|uniref:hypothetical protein n=1 Tax=Rhizobium mongolense TaxID=57676 RepID=UPI003558744E
MSDIGFLDLYAKFAGFKLLVSANRIGCEDEFSKTLHDRLLAGLDGAIHSTRHIMALQREQLSEDDPDEDGSLQHLSPYRPGHRAVPSAWITGLRLSSLLLCLTTRNSIGASGTVASRYGERWQDRLLVYH